MNDFSLLCRILGSLFYRQPQDPLLAPLFTLMQQGKLQQQWPLEQDELLQRLQQQADEPGLDADYQALFVGEKCRVSPFRSAYQPEHPESEVRHFLQQRGMPLSDAPADHIGTLLLAASWLEDQGQEDETSAQSTLFNEFLLPWCGRFLGQMEAHAATDFYRALAQLSREAIQAMQDELTEIGQESEEGTDEES